MATLGLKEMGKFLWEGREKGMPYWLSQRSGINNLPCYVKNVFSVQTTSQKPVYLGYFVISYLFCFDNISLTYQC